MLLTSKLGILSKIEDTFPECVSSQSFPHSIRQMSASQPFDSLPAEYTILKGRTILMNKEEILARSREENKSKDIYEQEIIRHGQSIAIIVTMILATIFLVAQILTGGGINYGLYALAFCPEMVIFWLKWVKLRRRHELLMALIYTAFILALSASHIYNLVTT